MSKQISNSNLSKVTNNNDNTLTNLTSKYQKLNNNLNSLIKDLNEHKKEISLNFKEEMKLFQNILMQKQNKLKISWKKYHYNGW